MSADFRCECGHPMSRHLTTEDGGGCSMCACEVTRLSEPTDPMSDVEQGAVATHTMFEAYLAAGFTRDEALHLVTAVTVEGIRQAGDRKVEG